MSALSVGVPTDGVDDDGIRMHVYQGRIYGGD